MILSDLPEARAKLKCGRLTGEPYRREPGLRWFTVSGFHHTNSERIFKVPNKRVDRPRRIVHLLLLGCFSYILVNIECSLGVQTTEPVSRHSAQSVPQPASCSPEVFRRLVHFNFHRGPRSRRSCLNFSRIQRQYLIEKKYSLCSNPREQKDGRK